MTSETKKWLGAGAVGALLLLAIRQRATSSGDGESSPAADIDALARMILTETDLNLSREEMAQIVWVAVNRAKRNRVTLADTVLPPGNPVWNTGSVYASRFQNAANHARWDEARVFVQDVLDGKVAANRGFTSFVHPRGMPVPPCAANRVAMNTQDGVRCMPVWIAQGTQIGRAVFA